MLNRLFVGACVISMLGAPVAGSGKNSTESLARLARSRNSEEAAKAASELRELGQEGLHAFLQVSRDEIEAAVVSSSAAGDQLLSVLDSICRQKDCYASRLFWHTNLERAKDVARSTGKPILSLRLLGRLDEDLSCANSRFFRIALYANAEVSRLLRERFVLHWESVRPVPRLTIDFGDGRKMERTVTGNSIHYILGSDGKIVDALPGLYGPGAFLHELSRAESAAKILSQTHSEAERVAALRRYHHSRAAELEAEWAKDVTRARLTVAPAREITGPSEAGFAPVAQAAAARAVSKAVVERSVLRGLLRNRGALDTIGRDEGWSMIALLHAGQSKLDSTTLALMSKKDPALTGATLQEVAASFERAIAEDTVRNQYVLRARIHRWFANGESDSDVASLNERVYSELFLTPSSDVWLGLRPADAYSAIDGDGVRKR